MASSGCFLNRLDCFWLTTEFLICLRWSATEKAGVDYQLQAWFVCESGVRILRQRPIMSAQTKSKAKKRPAHQGKLNRQNKLSKTTTDHEEIRRWAEARDAKPSVVESTSQEGTGIIRLDFPGFSGRGSLREISWDEFFKKFDEAELALVYQEKTANGKRSNFNKLVKKESAEKKTR